jgi:hypothetical protein
MAQAEIAANAQRDEEAGVPPEPTVRQEAQQPEPEPAGDEDEDTDEDEESEEEPASPAPAAPEAEAAPAEPVKYSRRDAARFASELEVSKREAAEAKTIADRAQTELNAARAADQHILNQLAEVSGYVKESNGQTRYANLDYKSKRGTATDEERRELAEMTQWHELAGPIYRAAEVQVTRAFSVDWQALKDLEGVGDKGLQKLASAPNGVAGAREMHALAYAAGQTAAKTQYEAQIARLKAENKSLKNGTVTRAPQPAVANGAAVPAGGGWRDRAFNADGSLNEDFDREVRAGKWLGVNLGDN